MMECANPFTGEDWTVDAKVRTGCLAGVIVFGLVAILGIVVAVASRASGDSRERRAGNHFSPRSNARGEDAVRGDRPRADVEGMRWGLDEMGDYLEQNGLFARKHTRNATLSMIVSRRSFAGWGEDHVADIVRKGLPGDFASIIRWDDGMLRYRLAHPEEDENHASLRWGRFDFAWPNGELPELAAKLHRLFSE